MEQFCTTTIAQKSKHTLANHNREQPFMDKWQGFEIAIEIE